MSEKEVRRKRKRRLEDKIDYELFRQLKAENLLIGENLRRDRERVRRRLHSQYVV